MTKKARWGVSAAIVLLVAGMIAFPKVKKSVTASKNASQDIPANPAAKRTLSVNAEILDYRTLSIRLDIIEFSGKCKAVP